MRFELLIIGDEILSGKRQDKHFSAVVERFSARGLRLSAVHYLGDQRDDLTRFFKQFLAEDRGVLFSCGGIGNTPDDHTRQAVAAGLGQSLEVHPAGLQELQARFGGEISVERQQLVAFPSGSALIPNPVNRVPGFSWGPIHCVPGFPQMAWPMIEWVLDQRYAAHFSNTRMVDRAVLVTGENAYESALLDLMERVVLLYPDLRLFSLPSMGPDRNRRHLELGVEGAPERVNEAMRLIIGEIERRGLMWRWREDEGGGNTAD